MTVFKDTTKEAGALADVAIALANGQTPKTTGTVKDTQGNRDVHAILETPEAIYKENVKYDVDAKGVTAAKLCTGAYAAQCTELGIS
jgi:D-xylose transport system substrate-binding protein